MARFCPSFLPPSNGPLRSMVGARERRSPSSVLTVGQNCMLLPRFLKFAARLSSSAFRCSARPAEKARQDTPPPFCGCPFLSTRATSWCLVSSGAMTGISSALPFRDATASSSESESLSCRYFWGELGLAQGSPYHVRGGTTHCASERRCDGVQWYGNSWLVREGLCYCESGATGRVGAEGRSVSRRWALVARCASGWPYHGIRFVAAVVKICQWASGEHCSLLLI